MGAAAAVMNGEDYYEGGGDDDHSGMGGGSNYLPNQYDLFGRGELQWWWRRALWAQQQVTTHAKLSYNIGYTWGKFYNINSHVRHLFRLILIVTLVAVVALFVVTLIIVVLVFDIIIH